MATKTKGKTGRKATEKRIVYAAARKHGVPGWLLWGIYGAENSWNPNNGVIFGLISENPKNFSEAADIAAQYLARLKHEHGSWGGAVSAYSGGEYTISHPKELAQQHKGQGNTIPVDLELGPLTVPLPGPDINPIFPSKPLLEGILEGEAGTLLKEGAEKTLGVIGLQPIAAFFVGLGELILTPEGWVRLAKLIGGAYLLSKGLNIVIRESTGADVGRGAKGLAETGRSAKKLAETAATVAAVK